MTKKEFFKLRVGDRVSDCKVNDLRIYEVLETFVEGDLRFGGQFKISLPGERGEPFFVSHCNARLWLKVGDRQGLLSGVLDQVLKASGVA